MTEPFSHEGLFTKAVLFTNRSLTAKTRGDFDEAALWASLALELLAKAALSKVNPCLIADPIDDGKSLLIAAGISQDHTGFKTIPAKAAFSRCARAYPPFSDVEALKIAASRNLDVHSAALPFAEVDPERWWQRYWALVAILLHAQDRDIEDLVGNLEADAVTSYLEANSQYIAARVDMLVRRAREAFEDGRVPPRRWAVDYLFHKEANCPACASKGRLAGDFVLSSEVQYPDSDDPDDYYDLWEDIEVAADAFACPECGLALDGQVYLEAAGLPNAFQSEREADLLGEEYMNE